MACGLSQLPHALESEVAQLRRYSKYLLTMIFICLVLITGQQAVWSSAREQIRPLRGFRIVVDPGHGGIDDGTRIAGGHLEKEINLQLALALRETLQNMGAEVIMTRETDRELSHFGKVYVGRHREDLAKRVQIVREAECDLFISLHCNCAPGHPRTRGPMVFYQKGVSASETLAQSVQARLNRMNLSPYAVSQRGHAAAAANYYLLRNASKPGVLVEAGFLSNGTDQRLLTNNAFQRACANSIALGIGDYLLAGPDF